MGNLSLEAQVLKGNWMAEEEVANAGQRTSRSHGVFMNQQDAGRFEDRRHQVSLLKTFQEDKEHRLTIKQLAEEQEQLRKRRQELLRASTIVECEQALKSWETSDLGQGHPEGGSRTHVKNRLALLERLWAPSKHQPPEVANDWQ